jgi:NAD(P)-dependent dehydrogenase (short-subunit alcohol dehydrogenase family)
MPLDERPPMPAALVTGGTTGIGRATAELLHARGYRVAVTGQNPDSLARARLELPGDVLVVRSDARVLADTDALVATVSERFGSLDLLFLNAGIFRLAPVADVAVAGGYGLGA